MVNKAKGDKIKVDTNAEKAKYNSWVVFVNKVVLDELDGER